MANPVIHWEIAAHNPQQAHEFYGKLFDWNVDASNPMNYGLVQPQNGEGIGGGIGGANGHSGVTFYVGVDDLDAYLKKAEGLGGKTVMPPTEIPGMVTFAQFTDPEGNLIGLVKNAM